VEFDKKDKTCGVSSAALRTFNVYSLNKQQNYKLANTVNFNDANIQKSIAKDAVFLLSPLKLFNKI